MKKILEPTPAERRLIDAVVIGQCGINGFIGIVVPVMIKVGMVLICGIQPPSVTERVMERLEKIVVGFACKDGIIIKRLHVIGIYAVRGDDPGTSEPGAAKGND